MKRLRVILLFLLLGAIINVAVAWGIAIFWTSIPDKEKQVGFDNANFDKLYNHWRVTLISKPGGARLISDWDMIIPSRFVSTPNPLIDLSEVIPLWGEYAYPSDNGFNAGRAIRTIDVRGWPLLSMWTGREERNTENIPSGISSNTHQIIAGYRIQRKYMKTNSGKPEILVMPLRPLWQGFTANTIFYAALFWLLIPGPFIFRRLIRRKRGLCVKCAYDLRGAEHEACPECGQKA